MTCSLYVEIMLQDGRNFCDVPLMKLRQAQPDLPENRNT